MPVQTHPMYKYRSEAFLSQPLYFRRKEEVARRKKEIRKKRIKFVHILFYFLLIGGILFSIQYLYSFLISWEKLNVKKIEISCSKPQVKEDVREFLDGIKLGNILLLDINHLQDVLAAHRWIKEVHIKKIFPLSLKIEIKEKVPAAVLKKDRFFLIDREGIFLEEMESDENRYLPLLTDSTNFEKDYIEKLQLAWECLDSLLPSEREQIEVLDLSEYENVILRLKGFPVWLKVGNHNYAERLRSFNMWSAILDKIDPLEYADLRFEDRLIIKSQKNGKGDDIINPVKEKY